MRHIRFLQISDIHLESACSGLPWEKGRRELRRAFSGAIDLAKSESVDLLLVPGDVYEHENETSGTARFLAAEFERASPARVIVTPGNHDFYAAGTVWQRTAWPENVHVFREEETSEKTFPDLGVSIYGFAHNSPAPLRSILQDWRAPERNGKSIHIIWEKFEIIHLPDNSIFNLRTMMTAYSGKKRRKSIKILIPLYIVEITAFSSGEYFGLLS